LRLPNERMTSLTAVPVSDMMDMVVDSDQAQATNYSYMFNFEQEFEHSEYRVWMEANWMTVCRIASSVYLVMIFGGQHLMADRKPFQLRTPLIIWNLLLSIFSIFGAARTLPEFIFTFSNRGIYHSLCVPSFIERDRVSGFWTWMFVVSKIPELGDTVFIVLRKQKLIFLHWYHHVTVLVYCWYSFSEYTAPARWFVVMNFIVHSLMYSYYCLKAMRIKVPRAAAMVITSLQLLQMFIGCFVNYTAYKYKLQGMKCGVSETNLKLSLLMYSSYFVLFARFFYNTYMQAHGSKSKAKCNINLTGLTGNSADKPSNDQAEINKTTKDTSLENLKEQKTVVDEKALETLEYVCEPVTNDNQSDLRNNLTEVSGNSANKPSNDQEEVDKTKKDTSLENLKEEKTIVDEKPLEALESGCQPVTNDSPDDLRNNSPYCFEPVINNVSLEVIKDTNDLVDTEDTFHDKQINIYNKEPDISQTKSDNSTGGKQ